MSFEVLFNAEFYSLRNAQYLIFSIFHITHCSCPTPNILFPPLSLSPCWSSCPSLNIWPIFLLSHSLSQQQLELPSWQFKIFYFPSLSSHTHKKALMTQKNTFLLFEFLEEECTWNRVSTQLLTSKAVVVSACQKAWGPAFLWYNVFLIGFHLYCYKVHFT